MSEKKEKVLEEKMRRFGVREIDITERFIRSGGPGGQKINKTSSCVYLKHNPTGIEVKCQMERSRELNRFLARRILVERIEGMVLGEKSEKRQEQEKIRRQKRKRSKRAKEKILKDKKIQSQKKSLRKRVAPEQ